MNSHVAPQRSVVASAAYAVLNPIPFGCFVAALIFDLIYARSAEVMWNKSAAWLILFGLLFAVIPRVINLAQVWVTSRKFACSADRLDFWLNLLAVAAAILNAFVHSRDAFAVVPAGIWLSLATVVLLAIGHALIAVQKVAAVRS